MAGWLGTLQANKPSSHSEISCFRANAVHDDYLATWPEVEGVTGKYSVKKEAARSSAASYDRTAGQRLWEVSAELTGL
ncbi:MAG: hypothetical protein ACE5LU_29605 [Anaerolineae bacterium]